MITLHNIVKQYNQNMVLNDISLTIEHGCSVAFTGHNGCGKTTLLKVIAGLVRPTSGKVSCGHPLLFHYVPENFPKMNLTAGEYLISQGKMIGLGKEEAKKRVYDLSEEFFLVGMLEIPMKHLSKGSLQKVGVVQSLLVEPDVLLLDEPLSGQDVMSQQVFIQKIGELRKKKVMVLMSCHEPYLVDAIADVVYRLENGKLAEIHNGMSCAEKKYILFFEGQQRTRIPDKRKGHLQFNEKGCYLRVTEADCNEVVLEMLEAGWNLRGMWNEDNEGIAPVSI